MSIEYFVEGQVNIQTKGDYRVFSKENIEHNAALSVEQNGAKTGVIYGKDAEVNPNDKPVNTIDVSLNLFFDGTGNNKTNTEARKANSTKYQEEGNKKDDSYENEFSNVAKGFDAVDPNAENQVREYIEGIGTVDLESDDVFPGQALGEGENGIVGKVIKGCLKGTKKVKFIADKYPKNTVISILKVNVYGFSRGAAAARHFVHVANTPPLILSSQEETVLQVFPPRDMQDATLTINDEDGTKLPFIMQYGYFGACLAKEKLNIKKIVFNFVGLYDTVASYGLNHRGNSVIHGDTRQLGLDSIGNGKAYFVLQFASDDEYRDNFDLTDISSTRLYGLEFTLPGVHSDIGGAYRNGNEETDEKFKYETKKIFECKDKPECERFREMLIEEGWFQPEELSIKAKAKSSRPGRRHLPSGYYLQGKRKLSNRYDKIPLNQMFHYSKQFEVKYLENRIKKEHKIIGGILERVHSQLINYMNACNQKRNEYVEGKTKGNYVQDIKAIRYQDFMDEDLLKKLRNQYLHWSVEYGSLVNGERTSGVLPASQRKRNIQAG
ncbi:MAG: phospholipase effector Tle1 domain-containing protein [Flavobacteriales bacterium]